MRRRSRLMGMTHGSLLWGVALWAACSLVPPSTAQAGVVYTFSQVGSDVQMTATGSLLLGSLTPGSSGTANAAFPLVSSGSGFPGGITTKIGANGDAYDSYTLPSLTSSGGTSIGTVASTNFDTVNVGSTLSGFVFNVAGSVFVPGGYTSGATINATGTFTGKTIAGMGFIPGTYTWAWAGVAPDSVTITVVPEPGAASLVAAFAATVGVLWRTRRRQRAANV